MSVDLFPRLAPLLPWLPGETLFSLCSRHHRLWGHILSSRSAELLFGGPRLGTQHDLPGGLDQLVRRTAGDFGTAEGLARERTLLQFYRPFLAPLDVDHAVWTMGGNNVTHLKFRMGLLTSRFRANHPLKACRSCMYDDLTEHGWVYWHLGHQYPGVWMCPLHHVPLVISTVKSNSVERFHWHLPSETNLTPAWDSSSDAELIQLSALGELVSALVGYPAADGWLSLDAVQFLVRRQLEARGWITTNGNVRVTVAANDYLNHALALRAPLELAALPRTLTEAKLEVARLLRPIRSGTHPLRLLVAIHWLFGNAKSFIDAHLESLRCAPAMSSEGDTPELPKSQDDRHSRLLQLLREGKSASAAAADVGIDVTTVIAWAAKAGLGIARRPKILKPELRSSLVLDLRNGLDKIDAAGRHGISIETVTRVLQTEIGLHAKWKEVRADKARRTSRELWLALQAKHPIIGIKLLRAMAPAAFSWLYRNDRPWLREHSPIVNVGLGNVRASSVQWDQRDIELSAAVQRVTLKLSQERGGRPLQLWMVYQALPELKPKLRALDRLPLTRRSLEIAVARRKGLGERDLLDQ